MLAPMTSIFFRQSKRLQVMHRRFYSLDLYQLYEDACLPVSSPHTAKIKCKYTHAKFLRGLGQGTFFHVPLWLRACATLYFDFLCLLSVHTLGGDRTITPDIHSQNNRPQKILDILT